MQQRIIPTEELFKFIDTLYFIQWARHPRWFIHIIGGRPVPMEGLEGAAYFDEKNAEKLLKMFPGYMAMKVMHIAKELPVILKNLPASFPLGHPLYGYDLSDIQVNLRNYTINEN